MNNKRLLKKIARLESKLDLLETEFDYLNKILNKCGFPNEKASLKKSAAELITENKISDII